MNAKRQAIRDPFAGFLINVLCASLYSLMSSCFEDSVFRSILENINSVATPQDATSPSPQHGVCIPQKKYQRGVDRDPLDNQGLVLFFLEDGSYLPVSAALRGDFTGLTHRDVPALAEAGSTVTLRFEWPGYPSKFYQLRTLDWCALPNKIPMSKLATEVAKVVDKFMREMQERSVTPEHVKWKVGPNGIQIKDLRLAALEQVSKSSWQVRLFYKPSC